MSGKQNLVFGLMCLLILCMVTPVIAQTEETDKSDAENIEVDSATIDTTSEPVEKNWADFMHFALIGKFDLAENYGKALLGADPDPLQLLKLAESTPDQYRTLILMKNNTSIREIAVDLLKLVEKGRYLRRTDTERIKTEVRRLSMSSPRAKAMAVKRLQDSGEWAVPVMIQALRDRNRSEEWAIIRWALPQIGNAAVNPLVVALEHCDEPHIKLIVLNVLGKIGYRSALPYIKQIIESNSSDDNLKAAAESAFGKIDAHRVAEGISAAVLFEKLGEDFYNHLPSLAVPADQDLANIWFWDKDKGLIKEQVPRNKAGELPFDELMVMRCCEHAVKLDIMRSKAIALWLSAFFRLEAEGHKQPQYFGKHHADAATYALTAGPEYLHRVLARALHNRNRPVALAAIKILQRNSGQRSLLYELDGRKPLLDALDYPDREVRFRAALAIGGSLPRKPFKRSGRVVPILAEALKQKGNRYAIIADVDKKRRNDLLIQLRNKEYFSQVIGNQYFSVAVEQAQRVPSFDLVILSYDLKKPDIKETLATMKKDYRMAFCPTVIISSPGAIEEMQKLKKDYPFVEVVLEHTPVDEILKTSDNILSRNQARVFAPELADEYATLSVKVLKSLAMTENAVIPLKPAEQVLVMAVREERKEIQTTAVETLAYMDSVTGQRAIANLAIDNQVDLPTRLMAFRNLAVSAKKNGNMLLAEQVDAIYKDVVSSLQMDAQLRNLGAEAYGSLNLPSVRISNLILDQSVTDSGNN